MSERRQEMARPTKNIDKDLLVQVIQEVENSGPLKNRSKLYNSVSKLYTANHSPNDEISPALVRLRIIEFDLEASLKTPKGKRGASKLTDEHKRKMQEGRAGRSSRFSCAKEQKEESINALRKAVPARYKKLVTKVSNGSRAAAVKLNCLMCVGYQTKEVRHCTALDCAMWLFRPYQDSETDPDIDGDDSEEDDDISIEV